MTAPTAKRVIEGAHQYVLLDLNDAEDTDGQTLLAALCRAIVTSSRVDELLIAGSRLHTDTARSVALGLIAGDPLIRDALRIALTCQDADDLRADLDEATIPADECVRDGCDRLADPDTDRERCPIHHEAAERVTAR